MGSGGQRTKGERSGSAHLDAAEAQLVLGFFGGAPILIKWAKQNKSRRRMWRAKRRAANTNETHKEEPLKLVAGAAIPVLFHFIFFSAAQSLLSFSPRLTESLVF